MTRNSTAEAFLTSSATQTCQRAQGGRKVALIGARYCAAPHAGWVESCALAQATAAGVTQETELLRNA